MSSIQTHNLFFFPSCGVLLRKYYLYPEISADNSYVVIRNWENQVVFRTTRDITVEDLKSLLEYGHQMWLAGISYQQQHLFRVSNQKE